jgi:hypothetical protein
METTLRVVNCPCCKKMLYALSLDRADSGAAWQMTKDSPDVRFDSEGYFVRCDHCMKRIAIEQTTAEGKARWLIARKQDCNRVLP